MGMLYESFIHPITILSGLPSAGVGALLTLQLFESELNLYSMVGLIMLIGIVKKNAIMMIDFALDAERSEGKSPGVPAALPPHHDDDHGCPPGRPAPRPGRWRGLRTPTAPRRRHRGRADREPGADALHDAGDLSRLRSPRPARTGTDMSISEPFIRRPIATTLLTIGLALAGALAFMVLPVV